MWITTYKLKTQIIVKITLHGYTSSPISVVSIAAVVVRLVRNC